MTKNILGARGNLEVHNWQCTDPIKYPYIILRFCNHELWYYGAWSAKEDAEEALKEVANGLLITYNTNL